MMMQKLLKVLAFAGVRNGDDCTSFDNLIDIIRGYHPIVRMNVFV